MIRNIVLFKLNEGVSPQSIEVENGLKMVEALEGQIPEIREWEVGRHALDSSPYSYDWALNSLFDDAESFQRYFNHPAHLAAISHWKDISSWIVVDMHV